MGFKAFFSITIQNIWLKYQVVTIKELVYFPKRRYRFTCNNQYIYDYQSRTHTPSLSHTQMYTNAPNIFNNPYKRYFWRKKKELKGHRTFNRLHQKEIFRKKLQQKMEWVYVAKDVCNHNKLNSNRCCMENCQIFRISIRSIFNEIYNRLR